MLHTFLRSKSLDEHCCSHKLSRYLPCKSSCRAMMSLLIMIRSPDQLPNNAQELAEGADKQPAHQYCCCNSPTSYIRMEST